MALIQCPDCGNMISENANSCPKCGYPLREELEERSKNLKKQKRNSRFFIRLIELFSLILLIAVIFIIKNIGGNSENLSIGDFAILLAGAAWVFLPILIILIIIILLLKK